MGNYEQLKQSVSDVIKTNGNQEITGSILQNVLLTIISTVGANATFAGIATPTTNPGTPDGPVFYLASENGTYTNFGGIELQDGLSVLSWNGSWSSQQIFGIDDVPTAGSDNLVKSGGVFKSTCKNIQFYNNEDAYPIIKKVGTSLYFKSSSGAWAVRGGINIHYGSNEALATELGVSLVDISETDTGYIELQDVYSFVFDCVTNKPAIKDRTNVKNTDIVLLANVSGKIKGIDTTTFGYPYIERAIKEVSNAIGGGSDAIIRTASISAGATSGTHIYFSKSVKTGQTITLHVNQGSTPWIDKIRLTDGGTILVAEIDVENTITYNVLSDVSNFSIQLYIAGLKKDENDSVIGGNVTFELYVNGLIQDFGNLSSNFGNLSSSCSFKSKAQFYNNEAAYPIIRKVGTSLYFKSSSGAWAGRGAFNLNYVTNAALATAMGVELVDISASDTGYIELPDGYSFVISSSGPAIKSRYDVTFNDAVLLANVSGEIKGIDTTTFGYPYIEHIISEFDTRITALENDDINISPWVTENTDVLIPQIRGHQTSKGITFAFLTDLHNEAYSSIYNPNNNIIAKIKRMVQGINIIKKDVKLWAALVGGDYLVNNNTTIKSNALKALVDVTVSLNSINNLPKLMIKGNHDDNSMGTVADAINPEEFYDNSAKLFEENEIIIDSNNPSGCYGYFDIKPQKIRIIFLNSVDIPWIIENDTLKYKGQWTKGIQQAQLDFVKNALTFTENGWSVIFVSHHGVTEVGGYSTSADDYITPENGGSQLWGIIKAFKNKTTFNGTITGDFASSVSVDYSNNPSNSVICLINGHTHSDRNGVKDGMLFLSTTTATQSNVDTNTDGSSYMPVANTKNEAAMDFITVDKLSGIIYLDRYGFGVSRKFYYTGDDIGEIPT